MNSLTVRRFVLFCILWALMTSSSPILANLYFYLPPLQILERGHLKAEVGVTSSSFDHPDLGPEDRFYLPDMHLYAQMGNRIMLGMDFFGLYRPDHFPQDQPVDATSGVGDATLSFWVDLLRSEKRGLVLKGFFMGKVPVASRDDLFGSDESDVFWGLSGGWSRPNWRLNALARVDVLSRFGEEHGGQWDFLTLAVGAERKLGRGRLISEVWFRHRNLEHTALFSLGAGWDLSRNWSVRMLAGKAENRHYAPGLDSMLEHQASLSLVWNATSKGLSAWLGR